MTNIMSSFVETLKKATNELILIQEEVESKIQLSQIDAEETLKDLKATIEKIKIHLKENISLHENETADDKGDKDNFLNSLFATIDTIKPVFEEILEKLKKPSLTLSNVLDIASLKIKLSSIYKGIFMVLSRNANE